MKKNKQQKHFNEQELLSLLKKYIAEKDSYIVKHPFTNKDCYAFCENGTISYLCVEGNAIWIETYDYLEGYIDIASRVRIGLQY